MLALGGAVLGVLLSLWEVRLLRSIVPTPLPPWLSIQVSGRSLAFTIVLAVLTGVIAGIVPALRLARGGVRESLATGVRGSGSARRNRTQRGLVVAEVSLAVVLLSGAGLLLTSLARLAGGSARLLAQRRTGLSANAGRAAYQSREAMVRFYDDVLNRLRATPGVEAAGAAGALPLSGSSNTLNFHLIGRPEPADGQGPTSRWERVTPDYFRALGIPVKAGREFDARDKADAPKVAIVIGVVGVTFFPGDRDVDRARHPVRRIGRGDDDRGRRRRRPARRRSTSRCSRRCSFPSPSTLTAA